MLPLALFLALAGCLPTDIDTGDKHDDTGAEGDADTDTDADTDLGDLPVVEDADAYCLFNDSSTQYYYWIVQCTADDPQGADTLAEFSDEWKHAVTVRTTEGSEIASYELICDGDGDCTGTFYQDDHGVSCASASSYIFAFVVYDQDGNASEAFEVVGREG